MPKTKFFLLANSDVAKNILETFCAWLKTIVLLGSFPCFVSSSPCSASSSSSSFWWLMRYDKVPIIWWHLVWFNVTSLLNKCATFCDKLQPLIPCPSTLYSLNFNVLKSLQGMPYSYIICLHFPLRCLRSCCRRGMPHLIYLLLINVHNFNKQLRKFIERKQGCMARRKGRGGRGCWEGVCMQKKKCN